MKKITIRRWINWTSNYQIIKLLYLLLFLNACKKQDPLEGIPSYLHIEKINLTTDMNTQGSSSNKITDAWIYLDDQLMGAFELPATIPMLKEGPHEVKIRAGIKSNGIAANRIAYPFYSFYVETINLTKNNITTVNPTVNYFTGITFAWMENFELQGLSIIPGPGTDAFLNVTHKSSDVFEGNGAGAIHLDSNKTFFECVSSTSYSLPKAGAPVFLELNYKCNNTFAVGVYTGGIQQQATLYIRPSDEWNKIYVNLTPEVGNAAGSIFNIYIGMIKENELADSQLFVDNIKLVYSK